MKELFRYGVAKDEQYFLSDRFKGWTGRFRCGWREWAGWYNIDIHQRLLGHYHLFQHFRKDAKLIPRDMPAEQAYIYHYRSMQIIKHWNQRIVGLASSILTLGFTLPQAGIEAVNCILVNEGADVLQQFLIDADLHFREAMNIAFERIQSRDFMVRTGKGVGSLQLIQVNNHVHTKQNYYAYNEKNDYRQMNELLQFNDYTQVHNHASAGKNGVQGKEKGVFSKKQVLILFDLLAEAAKAEKIDLNKPNKFDGVAEMLRALTGKSKSACMEELNNYRTKGLYETHTAGEFRQLISMLDNLAEPFRKAEIRSVVKLVDKKILTLEEEQKRGKRN